jgi:hypothetical protein
MAQGGTMDIRNLVAGQEQDRRSDIVRHAVLGLGGLNHACISDGILGSEYNIRAGKKSQASPRELGHETAGLR